LRFANVLGPGDTKVSKKKNAVTYMINEMKNHRPVDVYEGGEFIRDYIHVKDLCRAVNLVVNRGELNKVYNIGNGLPTKFIDIINYAVTLGSQSAINMIDQANFHKIVQVKSMYMDTVNLQSLGYQPEYSIQDIVAELYNIE
jgi:dTDP-glucose 4,6-dehydratase